MQLIKKKHHLITAPKLLILILASNIILFILERHDQINEKTSPILALVSLFITALYFYKELKYSPEHTLSYSFQIYYFISLLLSLLVISSGAFMIEVQKTGSANGSFWLISIFFLSGHIASKHAHYKYKRLAAKSRSPRINKKIERWIAATITITAISISAFIFLRYSSPFLLGIERADFWSKIVPKGYSFTTSLVAQTFFLAVALYYSNQNVTRWKIISLVIIALYLIITFFVLGHKFGVFIIYATTACLFIAAHKNKIKISAKTVLISISAMMSIYAMISISYASIGRDAGFIIIRLALQGQLPWSILETSEIPYTPSEKWLCFLGCGSFDSGRAAISFEYLPSSVFYHYTESGTGLSGFLPALPIYSFGIIIAFILHVLLSYLGGIIQAHLIQSIKKKSIIHSFISYKIYFSIVFSWYAAVNLGAFFIPSILILIFLSAVSSGHFSRNKTGDNFCPSDKIRFRPKYSNPSHPNKFTRRTVI